MNIVNYNWLTCIADWCIDQTEDFYNSVGVTKACNTPQLKNKPIITWKPDIISPIYDIGHIFKINMIDYQNTLFVHHHTGLGDHIVCNGMVRFILKTHKPNKLILITKNNNLESVKNMYRDCKNIQFLCVNVDFDFYKLDLDWNNIKLIRAGFQKVRLDWDVSFYDSVNIPFKERWDSFYYERNVEKENELIKAINPPEKFILVHDTSSTDKLILKTNTTLPVIKVQPIHSFDIFSWCKLAETAEEVHCIDSSFIHLAQMLNIKQKYFHNARNKTYDFVLKSDWNIIDEYHK